jgi:hypothetical protein
MARRNEITPGPWHYRPSQTRHIVSETGESVCRVHRGKKAQHNGPVLAASWQMLEAVESAAQVMPLGEEYDAVVEAIAKAKGETG